MTRACRTTAKPNVYGTYLRVRSSGLPFLTARAMGEPTTAAKRLG